MPETSTPPANSGDTNAPQENWEQRYLGLQKVVAKRDAELNTRQAELDALRAEHEAATNRLNDYAQRDVDATEEEQARQQYEALRERFEAEPPTPVGNNQQRTPRDWTDQNERADYIERVREGTGMGWPI
jgi:Skp family chaperone for outer membrane proteins